MKKKTSPKTRRLILIRHAHRYKIPSGETDNGLSPKGKRQAKALKKLFRAREGSRRALVFSSPKRRCIETVEPLLQGGQKIRINPLLDEGGAIQRHAESFIRWWKRQGRTLTVACSHGDWLPVALKELTGARVELKKGGWAEIILTDDQTHLDWIVQEPALFF